ncbi:MAG: terminase small subunit [Ruminococcus sp.]|nr:terminase small subunit [Ruminococcus sp.]
MDLIDIKDFVLGVIKRGSAEDAAIDAGVAPSRARRDGTRLLARRSIRKQIERQREALNCSGTDIRAGLERLAYGRVNDAVALAFSEEVTEDMLSRADLYNVSEIKKVKGGGVEIKFYDRQKALERLYELDESESGERKAKSLVELIYGSGDGSDDPSGGETDD